MNKKIKYLFAVLSSLTVGTVAVVSVSQNINTNNLLKADEDYTLTLNSANAYTSGSTNVVHPDSGADYNVTFTYSSASASSGNHVALASGGTFKNTTQITSISALVANFSGGLKARLSYDGSTWGNYFTLGDGVSIQTGSNPYFVEIAATEATTISSIKYFYTCTANPDAEQQDVGETLLATIDVFDSSTLEATSGDAVTVEDLNAKSKDSENNPISPVSSIESSQSYFRCGGIGMGSNKNSGSLTINLASGFATDKVVVSAAGMKGTNKTLTLNGEGKTIARQMSTSSQNSNDVTWEFDSAQTSLAFSCGQDNNRIVIYQIYLYSSGPVMPTPDSPTKTEIGFTASISKNSYYGDEKFDASTLTVTALYSDNTSSSISSSNYTYSIVREGSSTPINVNDYFENTAGYNDEGNIYELTVSYKTFIPQTFNLTVATRVVLQSVSLDLTTLTYTTAETFNTSSVTASMTYNVPSHNKSNLTYSQLSANGLTFTLLNPSGVTANVSSIFGVAGTWTAKIASSSDATIKDEVEFTVNAIPVTNILVTGDATVEEGSTIQLSVGVTPNNATNKNVTWSSSNESIATVNASGVVTGVSAGEAVITATAQDGSGVYGSITITVTEKVAAPDEGTYVRSDTSTLTVGSYVVFTNTSTTKAMAAQRTNNRGVADVEDNNGTIEKDSNSDFYSFKVEAGTTNGTYSFYDAENNGYLYASSSSANYLQIESTKSTNSSFAISGSTEKVLTAQGNYTRNIMRYNSNSSIFSCYGANNTQGPVYIYEKAGDPVYATSITINGSSSLGVGETATLTVSYTPSDTTVKTVVWDSSDETVLGISDGVVTARKAGTSTVTAEVSGANGTKIQATKTITVSNIAVSSVSLSPSSKSIAVGDSATLTATVSPANATNQNVTWSTSNNGVVTVSNGVITGVAKGSATVTVKTEDGNKTATCSVTVTAAVSLETFTISASDFITGGYSANDGDHSVTGSSSTSLSYTTSNVCLQDSNIQFKRTSGILSSNTSLALNSLTINNIAQGTFTVSACTTKSGSYTTITGSSNTYNLSGYSFFKVACKSDSSNAPQCASITITSGAAEEIEATSITLSDSSLELQAGAEHSLTVTYSPTNANTGKAINWVSSNTNVATVDSSGKVSVKSTATAGQTTTITATLTAKSVSRTCTITVVETPSSAHTVFIYMCGSDLESGNGFATGDIAEMLATSNQPSNVNIVLQTGGSKSWKNYSISNTKLSRYHINNRSLVLDNTYTSASMGKASTLQSFLTWGIQNYPADKYGLVLWNHGGGMGGVCFDEKFSSDSLTAAEVCTAVSGTKSALGISSKFEWIGYDACLMGVADIASVNADHFNYMVASEELEGGYGWDYDKWLPTLYSSPTATTTILGKICDSFISDNGTSSDNDSTLAVYDLSKMSAFTTAFNTWSSNFTSSTHFTKLQTIYTSCLRFGDAYHESDYLNGSVDAKDFINKIKSNSSFSSISNTDLLAALENLVIKNSYGNYYSNKTKPCGITIFFAGDVESGGYPPQIAKTDYTTSDTKFTAWRSFLINNGNFYDS